MSAVSSADGPPSLPTGTCYTGRDDCWNSQPQNFVVSSRLTLVALWVRSLTHRLKPGKGTAHLPLFKSHREARELLPAVWCPAGGPSPAREAAAEATGQDHYVNNDMNKNIPTLKKQSVCCIFLHQEEVLDQQQAEREDSSFQHACMFCSEEFTGNRWAGRAAQTPGNTSDLWPHSSVFQVIPPEPHGAGTLLQHRPTGQHRLLQTVSRDPAEKIGQVRIIDSLRYHNPGVQVEAQ